MPVFLQSLCCELYLGFDSVSLTDRDAGRGKGLVGFMQPRFDVEDVCIERYVQGKAPLN